MASRYIPTSDTEFAAWLANFNTVAAANLDLIGLSAADLTPSTTAKTALDTIITDFTTAQATAKASTVAKRDAREEAETVARGLAQRVQANASVPQNVKEQLGLNVGGGQPAPAGPRRPHRAHPPVRAGSGQRNERVVVEQQRQPAQYAVPDRVQVRRCERLDPG